MNSKNIKQVEGFLPLLAVAFLPHLAKTEFGQKVIEPYKPIVYASAISSFCCSLVCVLLIFAIVLIPLLK